MTNYELTQYLYDQVADNPYIELNDVEYCPPSSAAQSALSSHEAKYVTYRPAISLRQHLLDQINISFENGEEKYLAYQLTDLIDERGYLTQSTAQIAIDLEFQEEKIIDVLNKLKTLDPAGVYANGLKECLTIQLSQKGIHDQVTREIINNLEYLQSSNLTTKLLKMLEITSNELQEKLLIIKSLNPNPGANFHDEYVQFRVYDVAINKDPLNKTFHAELNPSAFPSLNLNTNLFKDTFSRAKGRQDKKFCFTSWQSASWLMRSLAQRAETVLNVAKAIIRLQQDFLELGADYLRPMKLSDVAQLLHLNESTISRVSNKFIETPHGLFEIKFFFTNSFKSNVSENLISSHVIRNKIKQLTNQESTTGKIWSDLEIAEQLSQNDGIDISRRTVVKYRKKLGIESSHARKRAVIKP